MNEGIERGLQTLDIPYDTYFYQFTDWECDNLFMQQFRKVIQTGNYQKVLSVNFSPCDSQTFVKNIVFPMCHGSMMHRYI